jgi:P pilus assembly chaperone PapD
MRFRYFQAGFLLCVSQAAWSSSFILNPWILVFEPQNKIISQVVNFQYQANRDPKNNKGLKTERPSPNDEKNTPVPVEISLSSREINLDGSVIYPSSQGADDFVVYPSQFILYPGDVKKVQVQWVGSALPKKEISLGFISTQLPLKFEEPQEQPKTAIARVEIQTRYEGIIVVRPPNVKPDVVVDTAFYRSDSTGMHMAVILNNKGTGLQALKNMEFTVVPLDANGNMKLGEKIQVRNIPSSTATSQSLMAGFRRKVEAPWPGGFAVQPIHVTVEFLDNPK